MDQLCAKDQMPINDHTGRTPPRDSAEVIEMREKYQFWVDISRSEGYEIFCQDETCLNKTMPPNRIWRYGQEGDVHYRVPSGKGEQSVIRHL